MSARRYSDQQATEIVAAYLSGESMPSLATRYGGTKGTVHKLFKRLGVETRGPGGYEPNRITPKIEDEIASIYADGKLSQHSIASRYGVSQHKIGTILLRRGIYRGKGIRGGMRHPQWKGGRITRGGYPMVLIDHASPYAVMSVKGRYVFEHRLLMAQHLGRPLTSDESVHHINGIKTDNRIENLQLRQKNHGVGVVMHCLDCGSERLGFGKLG